MEQKARLQSENKKNEIAENDDVEQDINKLHKERVREGEGEREEEGRRRRKKTPKCNCASEALSLKDLHVSRCTIPH